MYYLGVKVWKNIMWPWVSINLMPLAIFQRIGLGDLKTTKIRLLMVNESIQKPISVLYDVLVKVDRLIFPANFVILDWEIDYDIPVTSWPFLAIIQD